LNERREKKVVESFRHDSISGRFEYTHPSSSSSSFGWTKDETGEKKREDKKEEETMAMATTTTLVEFIISERYTAGRARESFVFFFSFLVRDFRLKESLRQSVGG
jgi:hypothetical protein